MALPETQENQRARIEELERENAYLTARQKAMDGRLIELEETLFELRDRLASYEGTGESMISKEDRKRLNEALDIADSMMQRFTGMMKGLAEDAERLTSKVPGLGGRDKEPEAPKSE